jgi:hypothetical protein
MRELAALVATHVERVRALPGMTTAQALIVSESNEPFVVESLYYELRQVPTLGNAVLLCLGQPRSRGTKHSIDGAALRPPDHEVGDLRPGIWTTLKNKLEGLTLVKRALDEHRLHMHRDLVTYSLADPALERQRAEDAGYDLARMVQHYELQMARLPVPAATVGVIGPMAVVGDDRVHRALAAAEKARIERLVYKEFGWMRRIVSRHTMPNGQEITNVKVAGKGGRDPENGMERRDDIVMACVMVVLGAAGFYTHPNYAEERRRLGIQDY